ncbi:MAG: CMP/dCMP deaminase zinc-binding (Modular protein) [Candidatus Roizmanbacteria bacterium GW2011_GWA2_35_8]|uniref:CMP/dCMP deaminase zinc-binding (Modular protein) n=1 Tax=Candidatus Roizmanbacteria bacterium GW2011_GWA2_35_8 TaxID=1618479 RepID=A0A0G0CV88_9BACT|nr:MAG: CMP/dCMP deaminase zinc-binding (Modular protein) [Candidatus Roizmanbacteria bacterium GW2011_GWA2_35_8]
MDGNHKQDKLLDELFIYAKEIMIEHKIFPYVSFIAKNAVIIARGYNRERETYDLTNQDQVVSIRAAQKTLDTGSLKGYSLFWFFEPTILAFDVALWSGITDFHWCINSKSFLASYNPINYDVKDYVKAHPGKIIIKPGIREKEALELVKLAKKKNIKSKELF